MNAIEQIERHKARLTEQQYKVLVGLAKSGDNTGALKGLYKILRSRKMEKQNNGVITDKNFKSNKIEPISNMAIDIMNTGLPLELAGAVATDLYEQGYRKVDEDYAIQCTCYALGCQQAEQIETKAKQKVAKQIFDMVKKRIHNEYNDLSNIVPTDDDYYLGKLAGISEAEFIIAELKKKYIGE